jgi:hypothetical protein
MAFWDRIFGSRSRPALSASPLESLFAAMNLEKVSKSMAEADSLQQLCDGVTLLVMHLANNVTGQLRKVGAVGLSGDVIRPDIALSESALFWHWCLNRSARLWAQNSGLGDDSPVEDSVQKSEFVTIAMICKYSTFGGDKISNWARLRSYRESVDPAEQISRNLSMSRGSDVLVVNAQVNHSVADVALYAACATAFIHMLKPSSDVVTMAMARVSGSRKSGQ